MSQAGAERSVREGSQDPRLFTRLSRIREAARRDKRIRFSALLHHVTVELLHASYRKLNPKATAGVDGVTWHAYGEGLEAKLKGLHERIHRGRYRAKPARRSYIPKGNGEERPLGIAALEDKIVQQATVWILEQVYWVKQWRETRARGQVIAVRYADDAVFGFQYEEDARAFLAEVARRLSDFGLSLNEQKTRLIEFGRYAAERRAQRGQGKPETFDFLGFTHISGRSRINGRFILMRRTSARRMRTKLKEIRQTLLWHRHKPVPEQGRWLSRVLQGYFRYHAIPGNNRALQRMRMETARAWMRALRRRSQRGRRLNWEWMKQVVAKWLPPVHILHPYPDERFGVRT